MRRYYSMAFKDNLRLAIHQKGWTVKNLSEKSGIYKRTLDAWLAVENIEPGAYALMSAAKVLNVSFEYLLTGKNAEDLTEAETRVLSLFREIKAQPLAAALLETMTRYEN